jgi:hypothetical protein
VWIDPERLRARVRAGTSIRTFAASLEEAGLAFEPAPSMPRPLPERSRRRGTARACACRRKAIAVVAF